LLLLITVPISGVGPQSENAPGVLLDESFRMPRRHRGRLA